MVVPCQAAKAMTGLPRRQGVDVGAARTRHARPRWRAAGSDVDSSVQGPAGPTGSVAQPMA